MKLVSYITGTYRAEVDGKQVGWVKKYPKVGHIGKWEWFALALHGGSKVSGPHKTKDEAAQYFSSK